MEKRKRKSTLERKRFDLEENYSALSLTVELRVFPKPDLYKQKHAIQTAIEARNLIKENVGFKRISARDRGHYQRNQRDARTGA